MVVTVHVRGDEIEFDLTGTTCPATGPLNVNRHMTESELRLAFKTLTTPSEPANEGHFRPLRVIVPDGCLLDARRPSPTLLAFVPLELLVDLVRKALAPAIPDRVTAADYGRCCVMHAATRNINDGSFAILADTEGGGWGARSFTDGENALLFGDIRVIPVEVMEQRYPVLVSSAMRSVRTRAVPDASAVDSDRVRLPSRRYRLELLTGYDRHDCPPPGLFGGHSGRAKHRGCHSCRRLDRRVPQGQRVPSRTRRRRQFPHRGRGRLRRPARARP